MKNLNIAFSPCPNDTFIFYALINKCIETFDFNFTPYIDDVEALNNLAKSKAFEITKLSFNSYFLLKEYYSLLNVGAALGRGCGPLLVSKSNDISLQDAKIAIPGEYTTAYLLMRLWNPEIKNTIITRFDNILRGIKNGEYDAGLIIHEGRFVYSNYGCVKIIDLGEWWEKETMLPIPLGCFAIKKDFQIIKEKIEEILKSSIQYGWKHKDDTKKFIKNYAQEMDDEVIEAHIHLYVNEFTMELGDIGIKAICKLEEMAKWRQIV
ncbi:MAG: 1,4-dihydroxy-6-naphthoate synthase [Desulfobacterales bacterium]|nr:1,4-dihydroxy-6-naphthoate synthase [Desulfobacterales bacterium]